MRITDNFNVGSNSSFQHCIFSGNANYGSNAGLGNLNCNNAVSNSNSNVSSQSNAEKYLRGFYSFTKTHVLV